MLNEVLHDIVARLAHPSEAARDELHAKVDAAVPAPDADAPDADAVAAPAAVATGTPDAAPTKGK